VDTYEDRCAIIQASRQRKLEAMPRRYKGGATPIFRDASTMPNPSLTFLRAVLLFASLIAGVGGPARSSEYPQRPVHLVVGLAAGGGTDIVARIVADWLSHHLGKQFIVENRTGMGGNLAALAVINAVPDGYTLLFAGSNHAIGTSVYKGLSFNFARDTVPIAGVMRLPNLMIVPPSLPVTTVREFIDYARANPNTLFMASSGNGTTTQLSGELFKSMTKIQMTHVPYRGSSAAYPDLMTGKVHVLFDNLTGAIELVRSGKLRALGITTAKRWPLVPDVPAIAETVPGYEASVWYGLVAPAGTPAEIVATLNTAVNAALEDPEVLAKFTEAGGLAMPMTASELGKLIADETEKWHKVVELAGISIN
jgi:tripartite-type tricarboxylate transporter receptor subunit TctC